MGSHDNVFAPCEKLSEAYNTLLKDQKSDSKLFRVVCNIGLGLLLAAAALHTSGYSVVIAVCGFMIILQSSLIFMDMSNRNFLLHTIDYIEWQEWRKTHPAEGGGA